MATPPRADPPKPHQSDPRQQTQQQSGQQRPGAPVSGGPIGHAQPQHEERDHAREEHEAREKHEDHQRREGQRLHARDDEEDDARKGGEQKRPKRAILPEGQAHQLFYNGHKIAREQDPPTQWLSMGRLGDGTPVVQSPMTPELEQRLKEGKFYLADNVSDDPPAPPARRDPL